MGSMELREQLAPDVLQSRAPEVALLPGPHGPVQQGEPLVCGEGSIRDRYRAQAFARIGVGSEEEFNAMDPRVRNTLITGQYASMYLSDPDSMKWAGMASYASDLVGVGIAGTQVANAPLPIGPGLVPNPPAGPSIGDGINGTVDTELLGQRLAEGNAGIYNDLMWQHLAMQQGGIEALREAAACGELPPTQLAGWEQIAEGQRALQEARASGDEAAIKAAQELIWSGNGALLHHEQSIFAQENVYDRDPATREVFDTISPALVSPIPGGESFANFSDRTRPGEDIDIGDSSQRVAWSRQMLADYRAREEGDPDAMRRDMRRFAGNADTGLPGLPVNTADPTDFQMPTMPDIPYAPRIGRMLEDAGIGRPLMPNLPSLPSMPSLPDLPSLPSMQDVRRWSPFAE